MINTPSWSDKEEPDVELVKLIQLVEPQHMRRLQLLCMVCRMLAAFWSRFAGRFTAPRKCCENDATPCLRDLCM